MPIILTYLAICALVLGCWVGNLVKLADCDFQAPYRCEVVHTIGVIPGASLVTAWMDSDAK